MVGVILNLAPFFAWHVRWPQATTAAPFSGRLEWLSLCLAVVALPVLWQRKAGIIPVIGICAVSGPVAFHVR